MTMTLEDKQNLESSIYSALCFTRIISSYCTENIYESDEISTILPALETMKNHLENAMNILNDSN